MCRAMGFMWGCDTGPVSVPGLGSPEEIVCFSTDGGETHCWSVREGQLSLCSQVLPLPLPCRRRGVP